MTPTTYLNHHYHQGQRRHIWLGLMLAFGWLILSMSTAVGQSNTDSGFTNPNAGDTLAGVVIVEGTAVHPQFLRYEVAFSYNNGDWVVFADGDQPVRNGTLGIWDTTVGRQTGNPVFPDGAYRLRLRIVRQDYNYDELIVSGLTISNSGPTPTPTSISSDPSNQPLATAPPTTDGSNSLPTAVPPILPSLTPFPTSTPPATPEQGASNPTAVVTDDNQTSGIAGQLAAIDTSRIWQAAQLGLILPFALFALFGFYLILRNILRRLR